MSIHMCSQSQVESYTPCGPAINQRLLSGRKEFLGYLRRRLGSQEDAEDVLQNFNLKVISAAQSASQEEKINVWMGQILRHTLIDHYRRRAARQRAEIAYALEVGTMEATTEVDHSVEPCRCLHAALERLRPEHSEILRRADLEEESRARIAADKGLTANALNVRLHRARQALRQELAASCPSCREGRFLDCACC